MLKKLFLLAFILQMSCVFAKSIDASLTVRPNQPDGWGYINASLSIDNELLMINQGITVPVALNTVINVFDVIAMNTHPKLDASCQTITIREQGKHTLTFELKGDWRVYCQYQ